MATVVIFIFLSVVGVSAVPEEGHWSIDVRQDSPYVFLQKHMFAHSQITVSVSLPCEKEDFNMTFSWVLRTASCTVSFQYDDKLKENIALYVNRPFLDFDKPLDAVSVLKNSTQQQCQPHPFQLPDHGHDVPVRLNVSSFSQDSEALSQKDNEYDLESQESVGGALLDKERGKTTQRPAGSLSTASSPPASTSPQPLVKDNSEQVKGAKQEKAAKTVKRAADTKPEEKKVEAQLLKSGANLDHPVVGRTWIDGNYLFVIKLTPEPKGAQFNALVEVRMTWGNGNYISAVDYPLLVFYGVLGLLYMVYGLVWLVLLACNWRDLLRVQFWIGGVIVLGMLEKAVFFAEYENINNTGVSVRGAVIFAELVSCLKRTLARMLVIIVSLGFGIVKPRLGQAFHKVLFVGALYFILAAIEGCMRATSPDIQTKNQYFLAAVPLAVVDAVICWWIFTSLVQTMRTLRLRRNVVKLSLYRHFTNTLIFAVLASVGYIIWFMTQRTNGNCMKDWKQMWVDEAFWHVLFVLLLFIIMLLWRPTANNQRYAFSPLLDAADDEDEDDSVLNDAFEGMKMRSTKQVNGSPKQRDSKKMEDDLKWVEEHIPSSVADKALPSLLDSDEEIMTTKFEMSKME
ncbi:transmembrane protein 87A-like [Pomacea canaliculata]|uniref:transmembrane protein 87A-like n=1 Tax=Pomacea canaliculata TaxID=400727 RepID=UPI000D72B2DB|nr:transmembrane protein 87A-like [Pomacea canaliculata]